MAQRRYFRRSVKAQYKRKGAAKNHSDHSEPRIDPGLKPVFQKIGIPEPSPFEPDPFQMEALKLIRDYDVLVSAPTGSGKTWIASQIIKSYLSKKMKVWYGSPLKALSNSIYQEFCHEFGTPYCGILTGDRKENADAPVIVGTTEILRNQLYDAMHQGTDIRADLVILDEAHYLGDPDRGVVWEEVLIYLPPRVKILLLSATISNAEEICAWLKQIRGTRNRVVRAGGRPVPLEMLFLFPEGLMVPLGGKKGLNVKVKKYRSSNAAKKRGRPGIIEYGEIINSLKKFNLLPAIFFLKSRNDCDRALKTCQYIKKDLKSSQLADEVQSFIEDYPHLKGHRQIRPLLESRVVSHHGGQLPYWKVLIERMMNRGDLDAIFSTSTVAAGVNFPARTVVLTQSDRFNGREFADLTSTELHQMIGRAGRRGKDYIGFALVIPGSYQDPQLIYELENSPPEPIQSRIQINFSMTINLLLSHTPLEVKDLLESSFATFQETKKSNALMRRREQNVLDLVNFLKGGKCDTADPYEILDYIEKRSEFHRKIKKLKRSFRYGRSTKRLMACLKPGGLFLHKNGNIYAVFKIITDQGRTFFLAYNIKKSALGRNNRFRLKRIDLQQIDAVFDFRVDIPTDYTPAVVDQLFKDIEVKELKPLDPNEMESGSESDYDEVAALDDTEKQIKSMPCETCRYLKLCHGSSKSPLGQSLRQFRDLSAHLSGGLWFSFKRHLRFLKETGFVDTHDRLTPDGYWSSKLRLDQPLLIAEAIRKGALDDVKPEIMAGGVAPFVWDRTQGMDLKMMWRLDLNEMEGTFYRILDHIKEIRDLKKRRDFENSLILFWPAAALYHWAKGIPWEELLGFISIDEGDMASLVMRTADHLRQVVSLKETHPQLASVAEKAISLIMREPVYIV